MTTDAPAAPTFHLEPTTGDGPLRGIVGLTAAELRRWFPGRALAFTAIGVATAAVAFAVWSTGTNANNPRLGAYIYSTFAVWIALLVLLTVATSQGAMANEIEDGTAEWIVAKPVGRPAFVLSKFIAAIPGVVIGSVLLPGIGVRLFMAEAETHGDTEFHAQEVLTLLDVGFGGRDEFTTLPPVGRYVGSLILIAAILLLIVAVMILLGCLVRSRAALFLTGLAVPIALLVFAGIGTDRIVELTPAWAFDSLLSSIADDPAPILAPTVVTGIWIVGVLALAVGGFSRKEL